MKTTLILATDIGTSSVRSMIYGADGRVYGRQQQSYPTNRPRDFFEQQDPVRIRTEVISCMRRCIEGAVEAKRCTTADISAIAFSSQMYSVLAVDREGTPLTESILWSDGRADKEVLDIKSEVGDLWWYPVTGCPPSSIYPIGKIRWIRNNLPAVFDRTHRFISIKEFVTSAFVDRPVVDYSMASSTGMFDIFRHEWYDGAVASAGISEDRLAEPVSGTDAFEINSKKVLEDAGLAPGTVLILGGGDGPLANIGSGASSLGDINIDLGTSGAARVITDKATTDEHGSLWCYCLTDNMWVYGGILSNVGNAFDWIAENILDGDRSTMPASAVSGSRRLSGLVAQVEEGAAGLYFLPYLRRARSPYWDSRLRGALLGLHAGHDIRHVARALIESIAYDLYSIIKIMEARVATNQRIQLSGGIARGENVGQIISNVLSRELNVRPEAESSLAGAAILGLHVMGALPGLKFESDEPTESQPIVPDEAAHTRYEMRYRTYSRLVDGLPGYMQDIG